MSIKTYKWCIVPKCVSTTVSSPEKLFFKVPFQLKMRKKWMQAIKRDNPPSNKSTVYCCEDHFDVESDMENYIKFKLVGGRVQLKKGVVPHKFNTLAADHVLRYVIGCQRLEINKMLGCQSVKCQRNTEEKSERSAFEKIKEDPGPLTPDAPEEKKIEEDPLRLENDPCMEKSKRHKAVQAMKTVLDIDIEAFIEQVKKQPTIWCNGDEKRNNRFHLRKCWEEVREAFPEARNVDLSEFRKKWKNLRDFYIKKSKTKAAAAEKGQEVDVGWQYYHQLDFLQNEFNPPKKSDDDMVYFNVKEEEEWEDNEEDALADDPPRKKRRLDEGEQYFDQPSFTPEVEQERPETQKSQDYHFLMSILPEMERLPILNRLRLRNKINIALLEEIRAAKSGHSPDHC